MYNTKEMDKFLETQNLLILNHKVIEYLYRSITGKDIESIMKNLLLKTKKGKFLGMLASLAKFPKDLKN